jgi:hypothetical protein
MIHKNLTRESSALNTVLEIIGVRPMPSQQPSYFDTAVEKLD